MSCLGFWSSEAELEACRLLMDSLVRDERKLLFGGVCLVQRQFSYLVPGPDTEEGLSLAQPVVAAVPQAGDDLLRLIVSQGECLVRRLALLCPRATDEFGRSGYN